MNIYQRINEITDYLEKHLEDPIDYDLIARKMGVNLYTMRKIFVLLTGVSISEYIRNRRLSQASYDLQRGMKVIDIATKYQYDSPVAFSRAFKKFHGILPTQITASTPLRHFPQIILDENITHTQSQSYQLIEKPPFKLYGFSTKTSIDTIAADAPNFFQKMSQRHGFPDYGMVSYANNHMDCLEYGVLFTIKLPGSETFMFPRSEWLVFHIPSQDADDIQTQSKRFYREFLPSCKYNLRELPELEYYHDGVTDFLVPIETRR